MLEFEGFEVLQTSSAEDGLRLVHECQPDIVVSDVVMPGMDGVGLVNTLRSDPRTATLPVILISGLGEAELARRTMALSGVSYLVKPFPVGDLLTVIRLALA